MVGATGFGPRGFVTSDCRFGALRIRHPDHSPEFKFKLPSPTKSPSEIWIVQFPGVPSLERPSSVSSGLDVLRPNEATVAPSASRTTTSTRPPLAAVMSIEYSATVAVFVQVNVSVTLSPPPVKSESNVPGLLLTLLKLPDESDPHPAATVTKVGFRKPAWSSCTSSRAGAASSSGSIFGSWRECEDCDRRRPLCHRCGERM